MKDKELFAQLLGPVPPWEIADMKVDYDSFRFIYGYPIRRERRPPVLNVESLVPSMTTGKKGIGGISIPCNLRPSSTARSRG